MGPCWSPGHHPPRGVFLGVPPYSLVLILGASKLHVINATSSATNDEKVQKSEQRVASLMCVVIRAGPGLFKISRARILNDLNKFS